MADNYLEKRQEELAHAQKTVIRRNHLSLDTLLRRNRSYRGFSGTVSEAQLRELVGVVPLVASGMNRQALRFRLVGASEASLVHPLVTLGAALPEEHLPHPGMEPSAYIVVCSTVPEDKVVDIDLGIAAQSMLLKATEMGLGGIFILNFRSEAVKQALKLELTPIAVIAIGKPAEKIFLIPADAGSDLNYYRKDGIHFVPKLGVDDLLLK
jgi:nitroreductase